MGTVPAKMILRFLILTVTITSLPAKQTVAAATTAVGDAAAQSSTFPGQAEMAERVRAEFLHAWNGYRQYAWGHDELRPLSKTPFDWYGTSLLMTPVDALDTMILMGLTTQADETRQLIDTRATSGSNPA